jgi:hypothetical protein
MKEIAAQRARQLQKERIKEQKAKANQAAGEAEETKDSAAYQTKGTVQNLKGVGVFKP